MVRNIKDINFTATAGKAESLKQRLQSSHARGNKKNREEDAKLMKACEGFEAVFLQKTLESMRDTLPGNSLFGNSHGMQIYKSMHDQYLAEDLSKSHKFGISDLLYRELQKKP